MGKYDGGNLIVGEWVKVTLENGTVTIGVVVSTLSTSFTGYFQGETADRPLYRIMNDFLEVIPAENLFNFIKRNFYIGIMLCAEAAVRYEGNAKYSNSFNIAAHSTGYYFRNPSATKSAAIGDGEPIESEVVGKWVSFPFSSTPDNIPLDTYTGYVLSETEHTFAIHLAAIGKDIIRSKNSVKFIEYSLTEEERREANKVMIDLALDLNDKQWFNELTSQLALQ